MTSQAPPVIADYGRPTVERPGYFYESFRWRLLANGTWMVLLLVLVAGAMVLLTLASRLPWNFVDVWIRTCLPVALTVPAMVMIIAAGGLDLSIGAMAALAAVIFVQPAFRNAPGLGLLSVVVVALLVGLINGGMVGGAALPGAVVTLVMAFLIRGSAVGGSGMRTMLGPQLNMISAGPMSFALWVVCVTWALLALAGCELTGFGLRPNPEMARGEGALRRMLFVGLPYVASSLSAAGAGIAYMQFIGVADPTSGQNLELDTIAAVIVGGTLPGGRFGNLAGAMVAVLLLQMIDSVLTVQGFPHWAHSMVKGGLLLLFLGVVRLHYFLAGMIYSARR